MDAKKHYEKYWDKKEMQDFFGYERNVSLVGLFEKGEKILDLGGGDGAVSSFLKDEVGADPVLADISEKALKVAKKRGLKTKLVDVEKPLPFPDKSFDAVFWGDNMEHLFAPEDTLLEIHRVLKEDGKIVLSTPNMAYWRYRLYYLLHGALADTEWTGNPRWGWSHIRFYNPHIIRKFLESAGFDTEAIIGVNRRKLDSFLCRWVPGLFGMILVVKGKKTSRSRRSTRELNSK